MNTENKFIVIAERSYVRIKQYNHNSLIAIIIGIAIFNGANFTKIYFRNNS